MKNPLIPSHKYKYIKNKKFDKQMPVSEQRERLFVRTMEDLGLQTAVIEYILHSTKQEHKELEMIIKQDPFL